MVSIVSIKSLLTIYGLLIIQRTVGLKSPLTHVDPSVLIKESFLKLATAKHANLSDINSFSWKLIKRLSQNQNNSLCINSLESFVDDVVNGNINLDTLQILDSWGKPESGILDGNIVFEGRYFECLNARFANSSSQYCDLYVTIPSSLNPFGTLQLPTATVGLCLPSTCPASELNEYINPETTSGIVEGVGCIKIDDSWKAKDILALFITCAFAFLVCISTLYDAISCSKCNSDEILHDKMNGVEPLPRSATDTPDSVNSPPSSPSIKHRILLSFSVIQNTKRLLDTTQRPTDITCLHGMRFLSMSWVILGHSFIFLLTYVDNVRFIARYTINHYELQAITNAFFSVDSFFYLSGLLVVYLGMRQLKKRGGKMNVPLMYFYRYLRLTPPYAFLILFSISIFPKMGDGPMWLSSTQPLIDSCNKYWYTNLLYINNLHPVNLTDECWAWGWYLANDTQFFLLTPLFLWLLYKSWIIGVVLINIFLLANLSITGAFSSYTKQQITAMLYGLIAKAAADPTFPAPHNSTLLSSIGDAASKTYNPYMLDLYAKPWCRIGAYLVGMLTGYILHASNNKLKMHKAIVVLGWISASVVNFLLVYCAFPSYSKGELWSIELAAFYNAVSRPLWCVGLAWVTIACVNGYGGPVNTLLSWKAFIPLSRLTYCSYLIHPLVLTWFGGTSEVQIHFSIFFVVKTFLAALVLTTIFAYIVAMLVEFPVVELLKILQESVNKPIPSPPPYQRFSDENSLLPNDDRTN